MSRFQFILGLILGLCLISQQSWAEKAYVTDSFKITFRTGPGVGNKIISMLSSGQPVEVLDSLGDWSHVRLLESGETAKEGWVLTRFLVSRLPWELRASSLVEENTRLKERLTPVQKRLSEAVRREQDLAVKLRKSTEALHKLEKEYESLKKGATQYLDLKSTHDTTRSKLESVQKEFQDVTKENERLKSSQRNKSFAIGALVLLTGLIVGVAFGRQQKKPPRPVYY
ncbi:MAG: TIGR04211 family SH3 domain-containing protein [candidate division Zixibacteria bacterium]|nr:TIGR04211 family SH3 domain-containing protein [candidate division Zixibacteria bacterium]